jgi:hypothetical protein
VDVYSSLCVEQTNIHRYFLNCQHSRMLKYDIKIFETEKDEVHEQMILHDEELHDSLRLLYC